MTYDRPVDGAFTARAFLEPATDWPRFLEMLGRYGMSRISAVAEISQAGAVAGRMEGEFAALSTDAPPAVRPISEST
jgi:hypothetical protein